MVIGKDVAAGLFRRNCEALRAGWRALRLCVKGISSTHHFIAHRPPISVLQLTRVLLWTQWHVEGNALTITE